MNCPVVRPAGPGDLNAVAALAQTRPFAAGWSRDALAAELDRADAVFLVSTPPGYALARIVSDDCRLLDIAAGEDGRGVGRALLAALQAAAFGRGCRKISFEVSAVNARALAFYAAAGAAVVGRRKKFYNDGSDALLMDLNLK